MVQMLIENWADLKPKIIEATKSLTGIPLKMVQLQAPIPRPGQLVCLAGNYIEPGSPDKGVFNAFIKSNTAIMPTQSTVELPPAEASVFHFEPELALVIGKRASKITPESAFDYIFGYTHFIDGSARGLPGGFFLGKSWHTFAPLGPVLVTADEIADPNQLAVKMWVNDDLKHNFSTNNMARHVPELLAEVTNVLTLEPGDVVATGTHHEALSPIQDGDQLRLSIAGLGPELVINVADPLKRTW
jgi:2-keto-4-pentenoate hydratase/2-oxohepta-3-ene-1,7-dioic acid hydratase in catechol pathway